ncbi:hypothetical protein [Oceanirhabdus sp. W0125-5]|uniref:hypothetical protein n=1 Tax=Oceanirhabdus sp. W0125-5 TaxID=2999116 RepID=UPI0022F2DB91|nr:hypothetical protein [Oceanirhabdus sp. W0125-5]WBW96961.1 hypothetical protein OW730_25215 [Oceanirhabdus sp. W0125-5]
MKKKSEILEIIIACVVGVSLLMFIVGFYENSTIFVVFWGIILVCAVIVFCTYIIINAINKLNIIHLHENKEK